MDETTHGESYLVTGDIVVVNPNPEDDLVGDITEERLGLKSSEAKALQKQLVGCYHLAAVYDLAVARDVAMRINVLGTKNVLDFAGDARKLERFDYVSTAYVSGTAVGLYRETDLDVGQSFKNHYEETKFLAEMDVASAGLPTAVYRPGIVVGDSKTGETAKFDGPYFALAAMWRLPSPGVFIKVGTGQNTINLVPVDFVMEALARGLHRSSLTAFYHLARAILVHSEAHFDAYDQAFARGHARDPCDHKILSSYLR